MISSPDFRTLNRYILPKKIFFLRENYLYSYWRDFDLPAYIFLDRCEFVNKKGQYHRVNPITKELDLNYPAVIEIYSENPRAENIFYKFKNFTISEIKKYKYIIKKVKYYKNGILYKFIDNR